MHSEAIISIKRLYAEAILDGTKTVEFRRRIPATLNGTRLWIYATRPTAAIIGYASVSDIIRGTPEAIWTEFSSSGGISREKYDAYFSGVTEAIGLTLENTHRINPIGISQLKLMRSGFHPPQVTLRISATEARYLHLLSDYRDVPEYDLDSSYSKPRNKVA